jgi:hypothetical protein
LSTSAISSSVVQVDVRVVVICLKLSCSYRTSSSLAHLDDASY